MADFAPTRGGVLGGHHQQWWLVQQGGGRHQAPGQLQAAGYPGDQHVPHRAFQSPCPQHQHCHGKLLHQQAVVIAVGYRQGNCPVRDVLHVQPPFGPHYHDSLDVVGKLYVSPNHKSTLLTKFVFVQDVLGMSNTNPILENNTSMMIVLMGDTDVTFVPVSRNAGVTGLTINVGIKPFLVAGGQLRCESGPAALTLKGWPRP
jgi:hypothetical protein